MPSTPVIRKHLSALRRKNKAISQAIKTVGFPKSRKMRPGFATLIRIIVDQQVSVAAGASIWKRLELACDGIVEHSRIIALAEPGLRSCGLSGQKARYALGVAEAILSGTLNLDALHKHDDDKVRSALIALKGIGPWTADIYLMFGMGRTDVWPVGDLVLQHSARAMLGLRSRPTPAKLEKIGESWRPYRSSAALMLWHYWHHVVDKAKTAKK
jgi:DNA-3-methyladenine glycosylase II